MLSSILLGGWRTLLVLACVGVVALCLGLTVGLAAVLAGPTGEALLLWPGLAIVVTVLTLHVAIAPHWRRRQGLQHTARSLCRDTGVPGCALYARADAVLTPMWRRLW